MSEKIADGKLVELTYRITDAATGSILSSVEYPITYVHGANDILSPRISDELKGREPGDTIEITFNGDEIFGPRDEALVFTDRLENVPEEYRKLGTEILMENDKGDVRTFYVTRMDDETLTVDGNSPFSGRELLFTLEILNVRDATEEELEAGAAIADDVKLEGVRMVPINGGGEA